MANLHLAWLAGFIDGEGTISLRSRKSKQGVRKPYWEPVVEVCNTRQDIVLLIQREYGGSLWTSDKAPSRVSTHKPCSYLRWTDAEALHLLECVRPYLVLKDRQADLVMEFIRHRQSTPIPGQKGHSPEVVAFRRGLAEECQMLNKKGATASGET